MRRPGECSEDLPEEPEELSEELVECLVALVRHPRLKEHVRQRAQSLGPTALTDEATWLRAAEQTVLQGWRPGATLPELRTLALERIADLVHLASQELKVLDLLAEDGETLQPARLLLRQAFLFLVGILDQTPFELFLEDDLPAPPEGDSPGSDGERDWTR